MKRNIPEKALLALLIAGLIALPQSKAWGKSVVEAEETQEEIKITELDITDCEEEMFVGDKTSLTVTPYPQEADTARISYESSDTAVLEVSASGRVTAKKEGKATITVRGDDAEEKVSITVREKTEKITLNTYYLTLKPGGTYTLKATAIPDTASGDFKYASTNEQVAQVSGKGEIKAVTEGYASITVSNGVATETVLVIVNEETEKGQDKTQEVSTDAEESEEEESIGKENIEAGGEDLPQLTQEYLTTLAISGDILTVKYDSHTITVEGSKIKNPKNELCTAINLEEETESITFEINQGKPLPGEFTLHLNGNYEDYKYLYLYNEVKGKYQKLKYDSTAGQIEITQEGRYLLSEQEHKEGSFNRWIIWMGLPAILIIILIYVFVKKRYWFW